MQTFRILCAKCNVAAEQMKKSFLIWGALGGIAFLHFGASAETANPDVTATARPSISAPFKTDGDKKTEKDCEDEWRANQEAMIRYNMTEDSYVEQCSLVDDVPTIPERKMNAAPSAEPN